eukprot:Gregarina_sp_Pseudo_9__2806@NODE_303_length_3213_cov_3_620983_g284_i0_p3_GENE_NODE_303_length_3213_cov_3_620983_g284_i0NODE_303_length_3213_cov_3_620983_g284_i0_p3_ORF_typecomplete_len273_score44_94Cation_ATPase_C/PF00689_21/1_2e22_NODE_303_length_3213_cov_3_620983_g284_i023073125
MQRPARDRKERLMTKDWWLYGNIPHTIFEAAVVLANLVLAMYLCTGVITLSEVQHQCLRTAEDTIYFCQSFEYRFPSISDRGWVTNIDFIHNNEMRQYLGVLRGKYDYQLSAQEVFGTATSPGCLGGFDSAGWCVPNADWSPPEDFEHVHTRGSRLAGTQSFVLAVFVEGLRAYTVRSWKPAHKVFNRNGWMHIACALCGVLTLAFVLIPGLRDVFSLTPISWFQYFIAIGWGLLSVFLDEVVPKPLYRRKERRRQAAMRKAEGDVVKVAVD